MDKKCDLCGKPAIADVKLYGGPWAYVCSSHYGNRENDKLVTMLKSRR